MTLGKPRWFKWGGDKQGSVHRKGSEMMNMTSSFIVFFCRLWGGWGHGTVWRNGRHEAVAQRKTWEVGRMVNDLFAVHTGY